MRFSSQTQIYPVICLLGYSKHFTVTLPRPLQELCSPPSAQSCRTSSFAWTTWTRSHQAHIRATSSSFSFLPKTTLYPCLFLLSRRSFSYCPLSPDSGLQNMRGGSGQQWIWDHLPVSSIFFSYTCRNSRCVWVRYLQRCWSGLQNLVVDLITVPYSTKYTDESCRNAER